MDYIKYNREERNICSHLFRLLHLETNDNYFLRMFLEPRTFTKYEIFSEVALIRDAYYFRKKTNPNEFVDDIIKIIKEQEHIKDCCSYSSLVNSLNNPSPGNSINNSSTSHPRQIKQKAKDNKHFLSHSENIVYGCLQAYFNAKPDLAIIIDDEIVVYEAKFTLPFDEKQLIRTQKITEIWAKLLYRDLGFSSPPKTSVLKLGLEKYNPDISWEKILGLASEILKADDKSLCTFQMVLENLNEQIPQRNMFSDAIMVDG